MANLIIIGVDKETKNLNEQELHPEEAIEKLIFETNMIPDVFLLKRQLQTYTREERMDLVGIDNENNILIIEIKDETVDESVIPQAMKYALWVETHPDAIKSIWLEQKNKPEGYVFDWEKEFNIKIMIIGPSFKPSVQRLVNRVTYPVELIEFKKFSEVEKDYIFLNKLIIEEEKPVKPVSTVRKYDEQYYKDNYNPKSAGEFWELASKIENYIKDKKWNLDRSNCSFYISFKYGFPIVFGITFMGSKSYGLFFKIPKETVERISIEGHQMYRYEEGWNQALYKVESADIDLGRFEPLIEAAYKNIVGEK